MTAVAAAEPVGEPIRFAVLGPVRVWRGGEEVAGGPPQQRAILALLLARAGTPVGMGELIDLLWPSDPPASAANVVHRYIGTLRRQLEPGLPTRMAGRWLVRQVGSYRLNVDAQSLDLLEFRQLGQSARGLVAHGLAEAAVGEFVAALELWRGPSLAGNEVSVHAQAVFAEIDRERIVIALEAADAALAAGQSRKVLAALREVAALHPLDEPLQARLMLALAAAGYQAEALSTFRGISARLSEELGIEPGPELRAAHQRVLRQQAGAPTAASAAVATPPTEAQAAPPSGTSPVILPAQLPPDLPMFTGRRAELARLNALLDPERARSTMPICTIDGIAGIGKTSVAVHWAHQLAEQYPDGQLYVDLHGFDPSGSVLGPSKALRGFLDALGVAAQRVPDTTEAQAGLYRSLLAGKRMLVLLDNARDANQVRALLPGTASSMAVVTSRSRLTGLAVTEGASQISLDVLTEPEARELLASWVGPARVAAEPEAVSEITGLCARLPLALAITAARAEARPGLPLATLAAELRQATERLDALTTGEAATDVRVVFSWSYRNLGERAARMFRLAGLHPGPAISAPAAASLAGVPLTEARAALRELTGACLLAEHIPGRFVFHDLLRAYATEQARAEDSDTEHRAAIHRMLDHYLRVGYPAALLLQPSRAPLTLPAIQPGVSPEVLTDHQQAMAWLETERQVLLAVTAAAASAGFDTHAWQISWSLATFLQWRGYWSDAIKLQRTALAATQCLGDLIAQASAHYLLGMAVATAGAPEDASTQMSRAPALRQQLGDPIDQARSHTGLAWVSGLQGRHGDALGHAQHALGLYQAAGHRAGQARALNAVGWHHAQLGDYEQSLTCCLESLALQRESVDLPLEADTLHSIGYAYHHLGHHAQAISYYQQVLDLYRRQQDRHHEAATLAYIGDAHEAMGNLDTARENWKLALNIHDELHHADAAKIRAKLGKLSSPTAAPSSDDASDSDSSAGIP